jgi:hypothetical protein
MEGGGIDDGITSMDNHQQVGHKSHISKAKHKASKEVILGKLQTIDKVIKR